MKFNHSRDYSCNLLLITPILLYIQIITGHVALLLWTCALFLQSSDSFQDKIQQIPDITYLPHNIKKANTVIQTEC